MLFYDRQLPIRPRICLKDLSKNLLLNFFVENKKECRHMSPATAGKVYPGYHRGDSHLNLKLIGRSYPYGRFYQQTVVR